jgi:large subunit ribosomal protein L2
MKTYQPTTPSRRFITNPLYRKVLSGDRAHKPLTSGLARRAGRNSAGRITTRHHGGGHKRSYRKIDFKMDKLDISGRIETIEYDPNRSGFIALVVYLDGERRYVLCPAGVQVGESIIASDKAEITKGNRLPLGKIPIGTYVFNIEIKPANGAKMVRSAGSFAQVLAHDGAYSHIKLPSSEIRRVLSLCFASIGEVSNSEHRLETLGKAGRSRWMGRRPIVRGSAMNPVDHPHGGGEGRAGRGRRRAVTKWGKPSGKGQKTRRAKKYSNNLIVSRRKIKKK